MSEKMEEQKDELNFGRLLEIDLSKESYKEIRVEGEIIKKYIGGKGLGAYLLFTFLKPKTDPLSSENILMFLSGPLTATEFPTSGRMVVVTKSPLTGVFLDSHAGGHFGKELRKTGFDGIIIKGKSKSPIYLWINNGDVEFREASKIWGYEVTESVRYIRNETSKHAHVGVIGPAGENLVHVAAIMFDSDEDSFRGGIAARGGPGAVMGSKNLKGIAVKGSGSVNIYNKEKMRELSRTLTKKVLNNEFIHTRRTLGTAFWVDAMNRLGILPTKNFQQGYIESYYGILASNLRYYVINDVSCSNCPIVCGKVMKIPGINKKVKVEYEDIALLGSNNNITNIIDVGKAVSLCNELGLDAISVGGIIGFAMECKERGILKDGPTFGDAEGQRKLIKDIAYKKALGELLSKGVRKASEILGKGSHKFAMHVKGMELPGYTPRSSWGMALAYATSDRGGCHQRAWTTRAEIDGTLRRFSTDGVAKFVKEVQDERASAYSLVICDFAPLDVSDFLKGVEYSANIHLSEEEYMKNGERIWNLIRLFNIREANISRKDDTLPPRVFEEGLRMPPKGSELAYLPREKFEKMLDEYYTLRGWDENGIPTKEKLEELELLELWR